MKNKITDICIIRINSTQNNTILTATNLDKEVISTMSMGLVTKSKRGKRSVPHGALLTGESLGLALLEKVLKLFKFTLKVLVAAEKMQYKVYCLQALLLWKF